MGLLMGVPYLKRDLVALGSMAEYDEPLRCTIRDKRQAIAYLVIFLSGIGFGLVLWCQENLVLEEV